MKKHLHDSDEMVVSPQHGWEQMQLLLDKRLPVNNKKPSWELLSRMMVAASFTVLFLFNTLVLNDTAIIKFLSKDLINTGANKPEAGTINSHRGKLISYPKKVNEVKTPSFLFIKSKLTSAAASSSSTNNWAFGKVVPQEIIQKITYQPIEALHKENVNAKTVVIALPKDAENSDSRRFPEKVVKSHQKRTWNLSAGLAMNVMIGEHQNFRPYPAAVLRYNISNNSFLSLGLLAGSHVSTESRGVTKKVYVNDFANNIQFYNAVNNYNDVVYADIPLLAGLNISKKISLQAGLQASVLLKATGNKLVEQYDFQMRLAGPTSSGIVTGTAAPVSEIDYKVEVRRMDYRFTSGIKYNMNKVDVSLMYQQSFGPVITGDLTSGKKNKLVTLNLQFKIK